MIKNNPSSKQESDLCKSSNGIFGFFLPCWNRSILFCKRSKRKKWMAIKETSVSTTLGWSDGILHIWNEYMQNTWTVYVNCSDVAYNSLVWCHMYPCKSQVYHVLTEKVLLDSLSVYSLWKLVSFSPNDSISVGSTFSIRNSWPFTFQQERLGLSSL